MDGYGSDTTADSGSSSDIAGSIAQIFSTGVTAYVDSQAIQRGYTINNPTMAQAGYPAGVGNPYYPQAAGSALVAPGALGGAGSSSLLLLLLLGVGAFLLLKKA